MEVLTETILRLARELPEGGSLSAKALLHLGSRAAVDQALSRLVRRGSARQGSSAGAERLHHAILA